MKAQARPSISAIDFDQAAAYAEEGYRSLSANALPLLRSHIAPLALKAFEGEGKRTVVAQVGDATVRVQSTLGDSALLTIQNGTYGTSVECSMAYKRANLGQIDLVTFDGDHGFAGLMINDVAIGLAHAQAAGQKPFVIQPTIAQQPH